MARMLREFVWTRCRAVMVWAPRSTLGTAVSPNGEEACVQASEDASSLRVAMVAPPWFPIPPNGYGGIEAMVHWLVEGLVAEGHQVTLIGAGVPQTSARFLQTYEEPPVARMGTPFPEIVHALQAEELLDELDVDVIHDLSMGGPLTARARRAPTVLTAHGPVTDELGECYRLLSRHHPMVAISESRRGDGSRSPPSATSRRSTATSRSGWRRCWVPTPSGSGTPAPRRRRSCCRGRAAWCSRSSGTSRSGS